MKFAGSILLRYSITRLFQRSAKRRYAETQINFSQLPVTSHQIACSFGRVRAV